MRRASVLLFVLALAGCSSDRKLEAACEKGDLAACDALSTRYAERAGKLCQNAGPESDSSCARYKLKAVPLDLPKAARSGDIETVFSVTLTADGETYVDSKAIANDEAIMPLARSAREKNPELRAVIKADAAVSHGRVIHVLDELKQVGISKIAFGVSPIAPSLGPAPPRASW